MILTGDTTGIMEHRIFEGVCYDLSSEGKGVVRNNGIVGFVDRLLPGEKAEIEITYAKKDVFYGKIRRLLQSSVDRVNPQCGSFFQCGGCALMHLNYFAQLQYKKEKVKQCLKRIGGLHVTVDDTIGMEDPYCYRNKIQVPVKLSKKGKIVTGFYKEKSHDIVPIETCEIEDKQADRILSSVRELMRRFRIAPYDEDRRTGIVRHILIRTSKHYDERMVVLVTTVDAFPARGDFIRALKDKNPEITTIVQNINPRDTNVILGERQRILSGKGYIRDILCGIEFKISPKSFYQVNPLQTEKLYKKAIESAKITKDDLVLDAYCGIGTIGLIASKQAKEVIGVEIVKEAVIDAKNNAKNNDIDNAHFYEGDAGEFILEQYKNGTHFDVVIMDPPRKGSDETFLSILLKTTPKRIVYVSCDPATLARDLKKLSQKYEIISVTPVDMFPHTFHVETLVTLFHKKPDSHIEVTVDFENGKIKKDDIITRAESEKPKQKVTYKMIQEYIEQTYGFKVHTAYIAEVKRDLGLPMYDAPNAVEELKHPRAHPTPRMVEAIKETLKHFEIT